MEVGIVGAVPFLIGLWLCGKGAWTARNRNLGLLPLALLVTSLAAGMGSNTIYSKALWLVVAVTVATRGERKRQAGFCWDVRLKVAYKYLLEVKIFKYWIA